MPQFDLNIEDFSAMIPGPTISMRASVSGRGSACTSCKRQLLNRRDLQLEPSYLYVMASTASPSQISTVMTSKRDPSLTR
jgi:hypothetical protein